MSDTVETVDPMDPMDIVFRSLARSDFPMLAGWLATPAVRRWWNHEYDPESIERDFGSCVDGTEPTEVFIVELAPDGQPVGLIQYFLLHAYDEYIAELTAAAVPVPEDAGSIDYLIGEPARLGRGVGTAMIAAFVDHLWRTQPDLGSLIVPVVASNVASWKALAAAGFSRQGDVDLEPDNPIDDPAHVLMTIDRPSAANQPHT